LKQFKGLLDAVKSSGASYMLLTGTEKENFNMLQEELQPFTIDDLLNMKPWHSLNYINCNNQYVKYISKLPEMIK
jgi:aryl-phospho-beta-D-glucosidase BglC (GH1 family)